MVQATELKAQSGGTRQDFASVERSSDRTMRVMTLLQFFFRKNSSAFFEFEKIAFKV